MKRLLCILCTMVLMVTMLSVVGSAYLYEFVREVDENFFYSYSSGMAPHYDEIIVASPLTYRYYPGGCTAVSELQLDPMYDSGEAYTMIVGDYIITYAGEECWETDDVSSSDFNDDYQIIASVSLENSEYAVKTQHYGSVYYWTDGTYDQYDLTIVSPKYYWLVN